MVECAVFLIVFRITIDQSKRARKFTNWLIDLFNWKIFSKIWNHTCTYRWFSSVTRGWDGRNQGCRWKDQCLRSFFFMARSLGIAFNLCHGHQQWGGVRPTFSWRGPTRPSYPKRLQLDHSKWAQKSVLEMVMSSNWTKLRIGHSNTGPVQL